MTRIPSSLPTPDLADDDAPGPDVAVQDPEESPEPLSSLPSAHLRARGTLRNDRGPDDQLRTLIYAPDPDRAAWIESELARTASTVTIQVGRRVRTIISALVKDPPPRPQLLIVDFDALTSGELRELHAIREGGWHGRLIGLGAIPPGLRASLAVDHVLTAPFIRDSLLDRVAGTRHAAETTPMPTFWMTALSRDHRK
jgi:hypothetical protein